MGNSIQQQLDRILALFLEEHAVNKARQDELNSKLEALTCDIAQSSIAQTAECSSHLRAQRGKGTATSAGSENSGSSSIVPKFTKFDFPRFNGQDDPLGWLSRCEHFFRHQQTLEEEKVSLAIEMLETMMTTTPILALPDFDRSFVVECDASDSGMGAVLLRNNRPIAYFGRVLATRKS